MSVSSEENTVVASPEHVNARHAPFGRPMPPECFRTTLFPMLFLLDFARARARARENFGEFRLISRISLISFISLISQGISRREPPNLSHLGRAVTTLHQTADSTPPST